MAQPQLEPLRSSQHAEAAAMLGRAFLNNPSTRVMLPQPSEAARLVAITRVMRGFVEGVQRTGIATAAMLDGRVAGVSLVYAPGQYPAPARALPYLAMGPVRVGPGAVLRYALAQHHLGRLHPKHAHYYLFVLGVEPEHQGKGLGGRLLRQLAERARADQVECYLETDTEPNVRLYRRHGYRVTHFEVTASLSDLCFWTMARPVTA